MHVLCHKRLHMPHIWLCTTFGYALIKQSDADECMGLLDVLFCKPSWLPVSDVGCDKTIQSWLTWRGIVSGGVLNLSSRCHEGAKVNVLLFHRQVQLIQRIQPGKLHRRIFSYQPEQAQQAKSEPSVAAWMHTHFAQTGQCGQQTSHTS